jgi:hypothetical protein
MEVRTNLGKFWEGQVQSGQKQRGSVRTKGVFEYPLICDSLVE